MAKRPKKAQPSAPTTKVKPQVTEIEVIARALIQAGSRVLLCQSAKHGYLYLPGGHVECSESAALACSREIQEELGWSRVAGPLLLVTEQLFTQGTRRRHEYTLVFHMEHPPASDRADPVSLEPKIAFRWTELAAIPDLDVRPASIKAWLASAGDLGSLDQPGWIPHSD